jgi:hypothetical protein
MFVSLMGSLFGERQLESITDKINRRALKVRCRMRIDRHCQSRVRMTQQFLSDTGVDILSR